MVPRTALVGALAALSLLPAAAAQAVMPKPRAIVVAHLHGTGGHDYHVEFDVTKDPRKLSIVVLYLQECHGTTAAQQNVELTPDGSFDVRAELPGNAGSWSLTGSFVSPTHATGRASMTRGACNVADMPFDATTNSGHVILGNPYDYPPPAIAGTSKNARRLRILRRASLAQAQRFATPEQSTKLGYVLSTRMGCPGLHHSRKHGTAMWGSVLDPKWPQSLVYWCDSAGHYTLAAFMYRAPGDIIPNTYGGLLQWHKHSRTATWMTHIWMLPDVIGAFATCAPFQMFAKYSIFHFEPYYVDVMVDKPCGDTEGLDQQPPGQTPAS